MRYREQNVDTLSAQIILRHFEDKVISRILSEMKVRCLWTVIETGESC